MTPEVLVLMEVARSQAEVAQVPKPHAWYCTHLLGSRMVLVVARDEKFPTWPGDLVTDDTEEATTWMLQEPEQEQLGVPCVEPAQTVQPEPEPERRAKSNSIVRISQWVDLVRECQARGEEHPEEMGRTCFHDFVQVRHEYNTLNRCSCKMNLASPLKECPAGLGCGAEL